MSTLRPTLLAILCTAALALGLTACAPAQSGNSASGSSQAAQEEQAPAATREEVQALIDEALSKSYNNVTVSLDTETSATAVVEGQTQQQVMKTSMRGELDKSGESVQIHLKYEQSSNMVLEKTAYDLYVKDNDIIIKQDEHLYTDEMGEGGAASYAESMTTVTSSEEISSMLDVAKSFKIDEADSGDVTVTITVDPQKLADSQLVDDSSLPEGSSIATLVASYTLDPDHRFKTIRLMSSTNGTPTYRVSQSYSFSDYDATVMPEWPDLKAYIAKQSGIQTDESGRMYIVDDDGTLYYVDSIDDDGMIHLSYPTG